MYFCELNRPKRLIRRNLFSKIPPNFARFRRSPAQSGRSVPGLRGREARPLHPGYGRLRHTEKLVPQPQDAVALGLAILNEAPIRSSTT
jgi:hypothetical protein